MPDRGWALSRPGKAHPQCRAAGRHVCDAPNGDRCIGSTVTGDGCMAEAGTWWGPHWCPDHDLERLDNIERQLEGLLDTLGGGR